MTDNQITLIGIGVFVMLIIVITFGFKHLSKQFTHFFSAFKEAHNRPAEEQAAEFQDSLHIVTGPNCVVTYHPAHLSSAIIHLLSPAETDQKIIDILTSNPNSDLTQYESILGIKIARVDYANHPQPPKLPEQTPKPQRRSGFIGSDHDA